MTQSDVNWQTTKAACTGNWARSCFPAICQLVALMDFEYSISRQTPDSAGSARLPDWNKKYQIWTQSIKHICTQWRNFQFSFSGKGNWYATDWLKSCLKRNALISEDVSVQADSIGENGLRWEVLATRAVPKKGHKTERRLSLTAC